MKNIISILSIALVVSVVAACAPKDPPPTPVVKTNTYKPHGK